MLEATLQCVTTSKPASWSLHLPWVEYSLNSIVSSATGLSPFQCSLGYQPPLFPSQETEVAVPSVQALLRWCWRIWKVARHAMINTRDRVQCVADRRRVPAPAYCPGQKVWLLVKDLPLSTLSRKLALPYVGPYTIERVINPSALCLQLPPSLKVHPVFHMSQVKPVAVSALSPPAPTPPPREVSRIHYLVDWVGYGPEDRSWVPRSYLADPSLLEDFYRANPQVVGQSPGVSRRDGGSCCGPTVGHAPYSGFQHKAACWKPIYHNQAQSGAAAAILSACTKPLQDLTLGLTYCYTPVGNVPEPSLSRE